MAYFRLLYVVLVLTFVIRAASDGGVRSGGSELLNRKIFWSRYEALVPEKIGRRNSDAESMPEDWELRRVPAGPDPLHHHGQDPAKPRTP